jgi:CheY-like chemotaxis protein
MIVDDVEQDRAVIARLLEAVGFAPPFALIEEGGTAKEILEKKGAHFQVAFVDLRMPSIDGLRLLKWVRAQPRLAHLKVVIITGDNDPDDVERLYDAGADGYFGKYPSAGKLAAILGDIVPEIMAQSANSGAPGR